MSEPQRPNTVSLPTDQELVLKVIPMPADCNASGDIFGGWVMAQVDFKQAVKVGDILSFFSRIVRVGRTSVTVKVEVFAERFQLQGQYIKVTEASLTYVAVDEQGKPRPVPAE
jgi:acyl-CoA thioesterase YciA